MVQWLRLRASTAGGAGPIPGGGMKIAHATQCGQKNKKRLGALTLPEIPPVAVAPRIIDLRAVFLQIAFTGMILREA